ncbi:MAG: Fis family transcriptional regulator [Nitrospinaceae bacterium]|nr:MAG: Fis family transcriptional regulator [Nitrospinaceae bacterium]
MSELEKLRQTLQKFGKENLSDILHYTATGLKNRFRCKMVRIYLEDLYEGMLICQYVTGQNQPEEQRITQFISPKASIMSQAFIENQVLLSWNLPGGSAKFRNPFEKISGIKASAVFPISHQLRPFGTLSLDWGEDGEFLSESDIWEITSFLAENSATMERAKRFHQQISFSKHLDLARKKEAAWRLVRSAVNLLDDLTLASVWVPSSTQNPRTKSSKPSDKVEVLAVFSKQKKDALVYSNKDQISILSDDSLLNLTVKYDPALGLVVRDRKLESVYIEDVMAEKFARKQVAEEIALVSLYQFLVFNKKNGQFLCAVNYYTSRAYQFSEFEKMLLKEHASMVEKLILEDSPERIEIQVLGEIEELLSSEENSLQTFLHKILDKTSELIGADSGTISVLNIIEGKPWLVVEDAEGKPIGAKSRGWMKSRIPPLPVGAGELTASMKSMTGHCAHLARPILVNDINEERQTQGFYKNLSPAIRSELAVPIIYGNNVLGVINQDSFRKNNFNEEHKRILQIIASLISRQFHNLKQIEDLRQEITQLRQDIEYRDPKVSSYYFGNVIGKSDKIHALVDQINIVVESICNRMIHWISGEQHEALPGLPCLLLSGETGTGKEFFFSNIYSRLTEIFQNAKGPNYKIPVRKTNIAAYSGDLTYSELFGHKKGAFTGAEFNRQGILEEANNGVVFLDEIGDADPKTQVQLLRFLDTGVFLRLGENQPRYSKIFLIAATNKDLKEEIKQGRFREDLYHRLNALSFRIPSLHERVEDIEDLATHFLGILFSTYLKDAAEGSPPQLEKDAIEHLKNYSYPGNVRELKNILLRAMLFRKTPRIQKADIMAACQTQPLEVSPATELDPDRSVETLLNRLESGEEDFWSGIHRPFRENHLTRETVKSLILAAKSRYQTNLPGLAVKLNVCGKDFQTDRDERKKFISFKNFIYKTVKISSN